MSYDENRMSDLIDGGMHERDQLINELDKLRSEKAELIEKIDKQEFMWQKGICPKCKVSMFDKFAASIHDVERCGNKKAVVTNFENA